MNIPAIIAKSLQIREQQVFKTISLLDGGATIPFISRYRKEATEGLDEVQITSIKEQNEKFLDLEKRKKSVLESIEEQGKLTDELCLRIQGTLNMTELEDIYLPYKPKRKTRASIAKEKGLEGLAKLIMAQSNLDVEGKAETFLNDAVENVKDAISGACDVIAEWISENESARNIVRNLFQRQAQISTRLVKGKEKDGDKYLDYFNWEEPLSRISSHRLLAILRAESEGIIRVNVAPDEEEAIERLRRRFVKSDNEAASYVCGAVKDAYKRLIKPSIETEILALTKEKADEEAIRVFATNVRQLLLSPPLGQKRVLGVDPGYRTGCKLVCLDEQGNLLHNETIYPHPPQSERTKAASKISKLVTTYRIDAIAIGNGTASRETEQFFANIRYEKEVQIFVVSENGASIYSASKIAREEFPEYDVTVRGAISIGRRLMDPLAELVKIDPKSIGVGQYQHDVDQNKLKKTLDLTVESCVNSVGVNLNTASRHLLTYVSGLGVSLAQNIVDYRTQAGAFKSRRELLNVPRMGEKSFEQCAGFMRIPDAENPLDGTAVHPESYALVESIAKDLNCSVQELILNKSLKKNIRLEKYMNDKIGLPTLNDIMEELDKPGRDPRSKIEVLTFDQSVKTIADLRVGQVLPGIVTNVTNFGCFVDVGIKENGLVHISELADRFVSDPNEIVSLHQHVEVKVLSVDMERKRVALTMKKG